METTNTEPRPLSRCEELWFSNKTIVIRVEETLFRINVDTLTAQSEVFRDMLALPQPADAETFEGSPVVRIEGTSALDMRLFLLCLHSVIEYVSSAHHTKLKVHITTDIDAHSVVPQTSRLCSPCPINTKSGHFRRIFMHSSPLCSRRRSRATWTQRTRYDISQQHSTTVRSTSV